MKFIGRTGFLTTFLFCRNIVFAQKEWKPEVHKDGIKVYSKIDEGVKIKALKAVCTLNASLDEIIRLLLDVELARKWICHTKSCVLLRRVSENELYYYTEVSLPWPLSNRDFVTHLKVIRNAGSQIVTVEAPAVSGFVPERKGVVRVKHSVSTWIITPAGKNRCVLEYRLHVDPGGAIPAWVINSFASHAPVETFQNMRIQLKLARSSVNG